MRQEHRHPKLPPPEHQVRQANPEPRVRREHQPQTREHPLRRPHLSPNGFDVPALLIPPGRLLIAIEVR